MWAVSDRFLQTVAQTHQLTTSCTLTTPGGTSLTVPVVAGSVSVDRTQQIRRTATLTVDGGTDLYAALATPGTVAAVSHGFAWSGTDRETVPMIVGELTSAGLALGDGSVSIAIADRWQRLAASTRLSPFTPAVTTRRIDSIIATVQAVFPGITIRNTATDTGTVGTAQAWTSRADQVAAYATDGGTEAYFAPDGAFVLRPIPQITDQPAWLIKTGPGGTLKALTRTRPLDRLYNTVILTPGSADPGQTWTQVVAQVTDPANARHPDRIGVRPYTYTSPSILTQAQAQTVAGQLLTKVIGSTESLAITALAMPALEAGDIVRVLTPSDSGDLIVNHFLQQFTLDLAAGDMTAATQSSTEIAA